MIRALTASEVRAAEEAALAAGTSLHVLMEHAGAALADEVTARAPEGRIVVLADHTKFAKSGFI
ncbi:MAG: bifunctional ADP-dependent NAD(P)H-hydrate dehydratase/NAD(P)H-hydrate epimerase, partial [Actinobacteria bacterium]